MFGMVPFRRNNNGGLMRRDDFFDKMFDNFFSDSFFPSTMFTGNQSFKVDVKEDEDKYTVAADLPGVKKDNISLEYENNYLTIAAKREDVTETKDEQNNFVRRERSYGELRRSFYVDNIDDTQIDAAFVDGVLKVTLPKKSKGKNDTKRIDIH
ncbi:heat shock protein Hsp18 [Clostridium felsineum]|uniref:18 kDa heat shock protein n=1 Tax=Clostridium felsineum TaxID=36839 RepID=A0A1S8LY61_9CLOT|nr:heat shock protein Hsp18 [Clostridium felsineum]MCR3761145.1 Hsp20/alpha crystallin family protein [Clostridium felsineum]URZ02801.1 18 kDa heat shock protein [Clostridium felsineum]URZ08873.1 18 kDa heat shock protein [Clostridium felsineum]URZ09501.1 18 kDa heat shock protein [Clostridium felsineum]URZ14145.1 18 kDa heat shock protein [Clostridium felsineum DSM 794]